MNYGAIKSCDVANGPGVRVTLFVSGCRHHCLGCFQSQTWDFSYGTPFTEQTQEMLLDLLDKPYIHGLTLLGGEPFEPENQAGLLPLVQRVRQHLPGKTIWAFSGFTWEQLTGESRASGPNTLPLLSLLDVLVDGPFIQEKKNLSLRFRGSENQRLIDVPATLAAGQVVLWES